MTGAEHYLTGLIAAPHTPMKRDGGLDLDAIEKYATMLAENRVRGVFVCGTTGEFASLTVEERMRVAERWIEVAKPALKVIVHAGSTCLADATALAEHAQVKGADAIAALAPFYVRPTGVADLVAFCSRVASAAPGLPFYYYHFPFMTGVAMPAADVLERATEDIPTLAGAKFTHEDLADFGRCLGLRNGTLNMLFGRDEILIAGLAEGARGGVGTTYNYAAPLYCKLIAAFEAGDIATARAEQAKSAEMIRLFEKSGGVLTCGKSIMRMLGLDCGPSRPPLRNLSKSEAALLRSNLERIGFFEFCTLGPG